MAGRYKLGYLILPLIGLIFGFIMASTYHAGLTVFWRAIQTPPEKIAAINGIYQGYLYITSEAGRQFAYLLDPDYSDGSEPGWKSLSPRIVIDEGSPPDRKWRTLPLFAAFSRVYETQFTYNIEGTAYIKLAVEPDGSLWLWKVTRPWGESILLLLYPVLGAVAGALAAYIWLFLRRYLEERRLYRSSV